MLISEQELQELRDHAKTIALLKGAAREKKIVRLRDKIEGTIREKIKEVTSEGSTRGEVRVYWDRGERNRSLQREAFKAIRRPQGLGVAENTTSVCNEYTSYTFWF